MWKKLLHQTQQEMVKEMSDAVYDFFHHPMSFECNEWSPLQIFVGANSEVLCKFTLDKIGEGSYKTGFSPLELAVRNQNIEIIKTIWRPNYFGPIQQTKILKTK